MPKYTDFSAAIFDVDDTLLSNNPPGSSMGLHEKSRLRAAHMVGRKHDIPALARLSAEDNHRAFRNAPTHSLEGATWSILLMTGQASGDVINTADPLLQEIVTLKDRLHEKVLRSEGAAVPGATEFVRQLAARGYQDRLAIASTAFRRDIFIALEILQLTDLFPDNHIISKDRFTHPKPHPEAFEKAFASLGLNVPRAQVLAFEDDPRGIMSAKAAGLYTCAITTRYTRDELKELVVPPDLIADSYVEFAHLLELA